MSGEPPDRFVTAAELETPRSAQEYLPWVLDRLRTISETEEGHQAILLSEGLVKKLREEALALAYFGCLPYENRGLLTRVAGLEPATAGSVA